MPLDRREYVPKDEAHKPAEELLAVFLREEREYGCNCMQFGFKRDGRWYLATVAPAGSKQKGPDVENDIVAKHPTVVSFEYWSRLAKDGFEK